MVIYFLNTIHYICYNIYIVISDIMLWVHASIFIWSKKTTKSWMECLQIITTNQRSMQIKQYNQNCSRVLAQSHAEHFNVQMQGTQSFCKNLLVCYYLVTERDCKHSNIVQWISYEEQSK